MDGVFRAVTEHLGGGLDIVFANAGVAQAKPLARQRKPRSRSTTLNVNAVFLTMQKALPLLGDSTSVILNGSVVSVNRHPRLPRL